MLDRRRQAAEAGRADGLAEGRRGPAASSSAWALWRRARTRAWSGSWGRTAWRPTTCGTSPSRSGRPGRSWWPRQRAGRGARRLPDRRPWPRRRSASAARPVRRRNWSIPGSWPGQPLEKYAAVCLLGPAAPGAGRLAAADRLRVGRARRWPSSSAATPSRSIPSTPRRPAAPARASSTSRCRGATATTAWRRATSSTRSCKAFAPAGHLDPLERLSRVPLLGPGRRAGGRGHGAALHATAGRPCGAAGRHGRVLVMTTPISDRPTRDAWNLLPVGALAKPWPFVVLVHQMMTYLVGGGQQQLNYFAGQTVVLPLDDQARRHDLRLDRAGRREDHAHPASGRRWPSAPPSRWAITRSQGGGRAAGARPRLQRQPGPRSRPGWIASTRSNWPSCSARSTSAWPAPPTRSTATSAWAASGRELYPALILLLAAVLAAGIRRGQPVLQ